MQMLVVNPERFSHQEIAAFGAIPEVNVYLAVSITDAQRLLGSVRMDVVVCNVISSAEIECFHRTIGSATTRVLLLGVTPEMNFTTDNILQDNTLVRAGVDMLQRLRTIAQLIKESRILDNGISIKHTK